VAKLASEASREFERSVGVRAGAVADPEIKPYDR
jgi:hypothetical protein